MCHEHRCQTCFLLKSSKLASKLLAHGRVQSRERLVEQEEVRRSRKRLGQAHPLSLPSGKLRRISILQAFEAKVSEPVGSSWRSGTDGEEEMLPDGEVGEKGEPLAHIANLAIFDRDIVHPPIAVVDEPGPGPYKPARLRNSTVLPEPEGPRMAR